MIAAISVARNEADIICESVEWMCAQVDHVYVAESCSEDDTLALLYERASALPALTVLEDTESAHYHGRKISALAEMARQEGAEWIVPFDADELWTARGHDRVADALAQVDPEIAVCEADLYDRVATSRDTSSDSPMQRMHWRRRHPVPLPKVAFRAAEGVTVHMGNHGVTLPHNDVPLRLGGLLLVHHFPYRSPEQFIRKVRVGAAAMRQTDLPEGTCLHWRNYDRLSDDQLREVFATHFFRHRPNKMIQIDDEEHPSLVHDPVSLWVAQPS